MISKGLDMHISILPETQWNRCHILEAEVFPPSTRPPPLFPFLAGGRTFRWIIDTRCFVHTQGYLASVTRARNESRAVEVNFHTAFTRI